MQEVSKKVTWHYFIENRNTAKSIIKGGTNCSGGDSGLRLLIFVNSEHQGMLIYFHQPLLVRALVFISQSSVDVVYLLEKLQEHTTPGQDYDLVVIIRGKLEKFQGSCKPRLSKAGAIVRDLGSILQNITISSNGSESTNLKPPS